MGNIKSKVYDTNELRYVITNFYRRLFAELQTYSGALQDYETIYNHWHKYRIEMNDSFEKLITAIQEFNGATSALTLISSSFSVCSGALFVLTGGLAVPVLGLMTAGTSLVKLGFQIGNSYNQNDKGNEVLDRLEEDYQKCQALVAVINRCENSAQRIRNLIEQNHCSEFVREHWDSITTAITDRVILQNLEKVRNNEADINDYLVLMPALIPEYFYENREFIVRFRNIRPRFFARLRLYGKMAALIVNSFIFVNDTVEFMRSCKNVVKTAAQVAKPGLFYFLGLANDVYDLASTLNNFSADPEIVTAIRNVLVNLKRQTTDITEMHDELVRG